MGGEDVSLRPISPRRARGSPGNLAQKGTLVPFCVLFPHLEPELLRKILCPNLSTSPQRGSGKFYVLIYPPRARGSRNN